jgi:hypothetical protein
VEPFYYPNDTSFLSVSIKKQNVRVGFIDAFHTQQSIASGSSATVCYLTVK